MSEVLPVTTLTMLVRKKMTIRGGSSIGCRNDIIFLIQLLVRKAPAEYGGLPKQQQIIDTSLYTMLYNDSTNK
jgi:hypothetical protein